MDALSIFRSIRPHHIGCIGGGFMAFFGAIRGHEDSKKKNIMENITNVAVGGFVGFGSGFICGVALGLVWPIAIPLICVRAYERKTLDFRVLFGSSE